MSRIRHGCRFLEAHRRSRRFEARHRSVDEDHEGLDQVPRSEVDALCSRLGVDSIVTGHTPHTEIKVYGQRIFDIDVGMTPLCGGNSPKALVFSADGIAKFNAAGDEEVPVAFGSPGRPRRKG